MKVVSLIFVACSINVGRSQIGQLYRIAPIEMIKKLIFESMLFFYILTSNPGNVIF